MADKKQGAAALLDKPATTPATAAAKSGATCTILCKTPNGIVMRLFKEDSVIVPSGKPGETVAVPRQVEVDRRAINGSAYNHQRALDGLPMPMIVSGYAVTNGVPLDFARAWFKANAETDMVRNKMVLLVERQGDTESVAKEHAATKSGLHPLARDNDPRVRGMKQNVDKEPVGT